MKILVVDNEEDQGRMIALILVGLGYEARAVSSGAAALEVLRNAAVHLVLTDLIMPEMDGTELCEQIKRIRPDVKVYGISGYAELYDDEKLRNSGFDGMIPKPIGINELKARIREATDPEAAAP